MSKWRWILRQLRGKLWLRSGMFCFLGIATALLALLVKGYIPEDLPEKVGADSVDSILTIIANSMLAVTTFSLSTMVAAYSAATSNVTPRSTQLLLQDSTAQNALSVFIGAFLFSLVGIIALSMEVYGERGRLVLFAVTLLVIALIIGVLLKWINYLSRLGRVGETIDMVERATRHALEERLANPYMGGRELKNYKPARTHRPVTVPDIGYVQNIDVPSLSSIAQANGMTLYVCSLPGAFNDGQKPLLYANKNLDEAVRQKLQNAFSIGESRSFDQDPRFGMVVLGEIGARALSAAVNDPGTAIDIIETSLRALSVWALHQPEDIEPKYPDVQVPALNIADLMDDLFGTTARYGAGSYEVGIRLQKALRSLAAMGGAAEKREAKRLSAYAMEHAAKAGLLDDERAYLQKLAKQVGKA